MVVGAICILMGVVSLFTGRGIFGWILLILGFAILYTRGGGSFNERSSYEKQIKTGLSIQDIFEKIEDTETPLGKPWLAKHKSLGDCIVFGPSAFKDMVIAASGKDGISVKHSTEPEDIIRSGDDEARFEGVIKEDEAEVSASRYSLFVAYKMASVELVRVLYEFIGSMDSNRSVEADSEWGLFKFYYHNSSEGAFMDSEGHRMMEVECSYKPFVARLFEDGGDELASVRPRAIDSRGDIIEREGFEILANGEHYGEIRRKTGGGFEGYSIETDEGSFLMRLFPACGRANVSCNYRIEQDGRLLAVIGGSPNLKFAELGRQQNDVILSYDDDYLVLYAMLEIFVLTFNRKFLK